MREHDGGQTLEAEILGRRLSVRIGAPGVHIATNALGALLAVAEAEGDVLNAAAALSHFEALKGRGARFQVGGIEVIDESYNANPASMAAALALLGSAPTEGRRIAVLGDMLEMGADGPAHHAALAVEIEKARADLVFSYGPQMKALWKVLPPERRGAWARPPRKSCPHSQPRCRPGDIVLVKGSFGSKMARRHRSAQGRRRGRTMFYYPRLLCRSVRGAERLPLHHLPCRGRGHHRASGRVLHGAG